MGIADIFDDIDDENIGDFLSDTLGSFKKLFSSVFDNGDGHYANDEYLAVALTNPVEINAEEVKALGLPAEPISLLDGFTHYKFKARTIVKNGPHVILSDPCLITKTEDLESKCLVNALIAAHTTIITQQMVGVGDILRIKFSRNKDGTLNLRTASLVKVEFPQNMDSLTPEACESIEKFIDLGENFSIPEEITVQSEIVDLAKKYDEATNIRNKKQHKNSIETLLKPFDLYVKAFLFLAKNEKDAEVTLLSGTRDLKTQKDLAEKAAKLKAAGKAYLPAAPASKDINEKSSHHRVGLAIDFNFTQAGIEYKSHKMQESPRSQVPVGPIPIDDVEDADDVSIDYRTEAGKQAHKELWINTGIPGIITRLGLKWGGFFPPNAYDPIHFELNAKGLGITKKQAFTALKTAGSLAINVLDADGNPGGESADVDPRIDEQVQILTDAESRRAQLGITEEQASKPGFREDLIKSGIRLEAVDEILPLTDTD